MIAQGLAATRSWTWRWSADPVVCRRPHIFGARALGVSVGNVAVAALLAPEGVGLLGALGSSRRGPYNQLHFTGPATVIGPVAIAAAVLVEEPLSSAGIKAVLIALIMLATGPILVHATGRAAWVRKQGCWAVLLEELEKWEESIRFQALALLLVRSAR